jgi:hypothetical protein
MMMPCDLEVEGGAKQQYVTQSHKVHAMEQKERKEKKRVCLFD